MPKGNASSGLIGLTHNVDKRQSARDDLATMGKLVEMKKGQEQDEQKAALIEQQYYEQIRKEADSMLTGDRKKINERSKSIQGQIRKQIKAFGGSRSKFMANGGLAMLGDYTRGVLESPEVARYKTNKTNLEQILDIKKKGMGHLLSARDERALKEYNEHGTGDISYSGLKNEIDMPPSDSFLFGTYATPAQMLMHDENYIKILGNYKIDNPNDSIESDPLTVKNQKLLEYTRVNVGRQRGSKVNPYGNQNRRNASNRAVDKDGKVIMTRTGELTTFNVMDTNISLDDMGTPTLSRNKYLNDLFGGIKYSKRSEINTSIVNDITHVAAYGSGLGTVLLTTGLWDWEGQNGYRPRGASALSTDMTIPLWKLQNSPNYQIEGNVIKNVDPEELTNLMYANGVPVGNAQLENLKKGDWKIKDSFMGYTLNAKGDSYMVVDAVDNEGRLDEKRMENLYATDGEDTPDPLGRTAMFITLEDPKGNEYVQRIDYKGSVKESLLADYIGKEANDLSDQYYERKGNQEGLDEKKRQVTSMRAGKANLEVLHELFDDNVAFNQQVAFYNSYSANGNMRSDLMKAYYMTQFDLLSDEDNPSPNLDLTSSINANEFTNIFIESLGLENELKNTKLTDTDFLKLIEKTMLTKEMSGPEGEFLQSNMTLIEKMKNYLTKVRTTPTEKKKAEDGAQFGFTPGSQWSVTKDFKGPSHSKGGIDVNTENL